MKNIIIIPLTKPVLALTLIVGLAGASIGHPTYAYNTCITCTQIPKPNPMCTLELESSPIVEACGSEVWYTMFMTERECKQFNKITEHCANGSYVTYTFEYWYGENSKCDTGSAATMCYAP